MTVRHEAHAVRGSIVLALPILLIGSSILGIVFFAEGLWGILACVGLGILGATLVVVARARAWRRAQRASDADRDLHGIFR